MINPGNTGFLIVCASMVFMMIPGVGYFYSGMLSSKAALSIIFLCFLTYSIVLVQWYLFGYSLVYADDGGPFIGTLTNGAFTGLKDKEIDGIPYNAFAIFQAMFAGITPALIIGAGSETVRLLPKMLFVFLWTTLVYDFVAYWTWNNNGFLKKLGAIDFAGGGPVHIATGASALAFLIFLGRKGLTQPSVAHSPANILLGTMFLWFGWIGFNGGSAIVAGPRAALAIITTNMSAAAGSLTWMIWNYFRYKKISSVAFCSGAIAGLVVITPGAGYSSPIYAFVMGVMGTSTCALASWVASVYQLEDTVV